MKSVKLEWCLGEIDEAKTLLDESVKLYPDYAKLWMMKGQIQVQLQRPDAAREDYKQGVSTTSRPTLPSFTPARPRYKILLHIRTYRQKLDAAVLVKLRSSRRADRNARNCI